MKSISIALAVLVALFTTSALAQSDSHAAFEKLKSLQGSWTGKGSEGQSLHVSFRVTSNGSAIMSEIQGPEDNMITMFHLDGDRLMMTHYCGSGNQPRMVGTMSADGKTISFNFLDATNVLSSQPGHMERLVMTMSDPNHHTEEWSFLAQDGKMHHHEMFDLQRQK
jgi:hypothetical protein